MADDENATQVASGSSLVQNGGSDPAHWQMCWILYTCCEGVGCVNPKSQMPRCIEMNQKTLCIKREMGVDFGTKEKLCGMGSGGECMMVDGKVTCVACKQACFCEGCLNKEDGSCIKQTMMCFCRTKEKEVGGSGEGKFCCIRGNCENKLEMPWDENYVFIRSACRLCCCFSRELAKCTSVGGPEGIIGCNDRLCCIVNNCVLPPSTLFCEIFSFRLFGPPKTRSIEMGGGCQVAPTPPDGQVVAAANFGSSKETFTPLPDRLSMDGKVGGAGGEDDDAVFSPRVEWHKEPRILWGSAPVPHEGSYASPKAAIPETLRM